MFASDQYRLLDFGDGRKLDQFGRYVLDRPSPAAIGVAKADPQQWELAQARFIADRGIAAGCGTRGHWAPDLTASEAWTIRHGSAVFELRTTEFGHVGVFPEQAENWDWIAERVDQCHRSGIEKPRVLNLFAYTGGSTLAAAAAGAEVVHIDASKSTVAWARRNAELSALSTAPIRWICEDARSFVRREQRRGNRYHGVVLDPPTYGHGADGQTWQIDRDLPPLLEGCGRLLVEDGGFVLVTCHSPGLSPSMLSDQARAALSRPTKTKIEARDLWIPTANGRHLHSGIMVRWQCR